MFEFDINSIDPKTIEKLDKNMLYSNKHIDLILYFSKLKSRSFLALEIDLIKWLINLGIY